MREITTLQNTWINSYLDSQMQPVRFACSCPSFQKYTREMIFCHSLTWIYADIPYLNLINPLIIPCLSMGLSDPGYKTMLALEESKEETSWLNQKDLRSRSSFV